jgi:hypothetical protein
MEQFPEGKATERVEQEIRAHCCVCRQPWSSYRGKHKCMQVQCGVPVLVCDPCQRLASDQPQSLQCELCREGYRAPQHTPDLVALKRKAEKIQQQSKMMMMSQQSRKDSGGGTNEDGNDSGTTTPPSTTINKKGRLMAERVPCPDRLFLSRLPLTVSKTNLVEWLKVPIGQVHWLTDRDTGAFYGSCIVQIVNTNVDTVDTIVATIINDPKSLGPLRGATRNRQPRVEQAMMLVTEGRGGRDDEVWPPPDYVQSEFPPLGRILGMNQ